MKKHKENNRNETLYKLTSTLLTNYTFISDPLASHLPQEAQES